LHFLRNHISHFFIFCLLVYGIIDGGLVAHLTMASQEESELVHCGMGSFLTRIFNGQEIHQRRSDGYVCITEMAKASGKKNKDVKYYNRSARARDYKAALLNLLGKSGDQKVTYYFI
jgi:hypothetical protein